MNINRMKFDSEILPENRIKAGAVYFDTKTESYSLCLASRCEGDHTRGEFKVFGFRQETIYQGTPRMRQLEMVQEPISPRAFNRCMEEIRKLNAQIKAQAKQIEALLIKSASPTASPGRSTPPTPRAKKPLRAPK
jgi:hypothetical protein